MSGIFNPPVPTTKGLVIRPKFRWKDADEIYIGAGVYHHNGTTEQTVYWDSEIAFQLGSAGSNSASDDLGVSEWHYIYLDDSAIVNQASALLDADCFLNDTTAPTYSVSKHGWYNGLDRCVFGILTTGANAVIEFNHDGGDTVFWADHVESQAAVDIDDIFTDIGTLDIPGFSTRALVSIYGSVLGNIYWYWRTNGQTGTMGNILGYSVVDAFTDSTEVITDSSQIIEVKASDSNGSKISVWTEAWKFPVGI